MASVRRVPKSPYWIAKYRDGDVIKFRSTKQPLRCKSKALQIAIDWENLAKKANEGELTQATVFKFANELLERVGQSSVGKISTSAFAIDWLKRGLKADTTRKRYESVISSFLKFIGPKRAAASIGSITNDEIERFRDEELTKGKSASTADFGLKVIRAMMESAKRKNQRLDNPADAVEHLQVEQQEKEPFSDEQLSRLFHAADQQWRGMILFGAYAGLRLNDAANLKWSQINLATQSLKFVPAKTALRKPKGIEVALHESIVAYLNSLPRPRNKESPVFPSLAGKKSGSAGGLSNQFTNILVKLGIRQPTVVGSSSARKSKGRTFNPLGFHSTRHYFISKLANADVPREVRKAMAGHTADQAHSKYVHLELETQKRAIKKLPALKITIEK